MRTQPTCLAAALVSASLIALFPGTLRADDVEECRTSQNDFWICKGDKAWVNGYLIPPVVFDLRQCQVWKEGYDLLDQTNKERDEYKDQRDRTLKTLEAETQRAETLASSYDRCTDSLTQQIESTESCLRDLDSAYTVWDMVLLGAGVGLAAAAAGVLVGALAL